MKLKILITFLALWFVGCDDFLEEQSQSEVRPSTVTDMEKILESDAYFSIAEGHLFNRKTDIFTDDIQCNLLDYASQKIQKENERYRFIWDVMMFNDEGGGQDISFWSVPYERIKGCNVVLEYIDGMSGDEVKKEHLRGEAYTLRGFYYYMLVNFFGKPYNHEDPTKSLGVPLKLVTGVTNERFKRNTVAECYERIVKDLSKGTEIMLANKEGASKKSERLKYLAGYALLSRVYLHMEDWDNVIKYCDLVLEEKSELLDLKNMSDGGVYVQEKTPTEILWQRNEMKPEWLVMLEPYAVSRDLVDLYERDVDNQIEDIRGDTKSSPTYIRKSSWGYGWYAGVIKGNASNYWTNGGIRTAELYLNRAEANIRKYIASGDQEKARLALADLNELRKNRFKAGYADKQLTDFTNGEDLLEFCLRERRRELCAEANHRWFDLRRLGMPELKHVYIDDDNGRETEYVLYKNDSRYVLPIPAEVIRRNPNLRESE